MSLKIKTKELTKFLKKARMGGMQLLNEAVLKFEDDGLKITAMSASQQAQVSALLKPSGFIEYEAIKNVPMNDLVNAVKVIERFGEEITLKKEGNLLIISGKTKTSNKKVGIELPNENYLTSDDSKPNLEFTETFQADAATLNEIFADIQLNKNVVLTLTTEEKKVLVTNTGKYKFTHTLEAPSCTGGTIVNMGEPFIDAISNLDGKLEISVKTDFPARIREVCEHSVIALIVAPRSEEE